MISPVTDHLSCGHCFFFKCLTVFPFNGHLWLAGQIVLRFYVRISYLMIRSLDI